MSAHLNDPQSIIDYCRSCPEDQLISKYGNRVVKLPDCDMVVKFGQAVSFHEKENQRRAYQLLDANIVTVPQVHDFFVDDEGWGYMVSDFIQGQTIDPLTDTHIQTLAKILEYFCSITSSTAGSLSGGPSIGVLWPDTNDLSISSVQEVEEWFNSRLFPEDGQVHFDTGPLVMCHLDIAPRNIISLDDGRVCLLDWASAGFYPRMLEFASLSFQEYRFSKMLLNAVCFGSESEKEQQRKICRALYNNERYSL